jgi:histidinol-phosphate/aromatic aminotransferase/cobyric acid decarboxylase-like protein
MNATSAEVPCFHGGAFFAGIGERFKTLDRSRSIINADVLDAWFPPAPGVITAVQEYLPWLLRTSPPVNADGLLEAIAEARAVSKKCLVPGAGSSDLIFRAFTHWLTPKSRVLILDPIYSEYPHILEKAIGCCVERLTLRRDENYQINLPALRQALRTGFDLVVLVNPNSPTGQFVSREALCDVLDDVPQKTLIWVDEAYIDYVAASESIERFATTSTNIVVCKSMSKVYALSGARVAYLCGAPELLRSIRAITPPWVVGLVGQLAAVKALEDADYYRERYLETHRLREVMASALSELGWGVLAGRANFLLAHLPDDGPSADSIIQECIRRDLYLRNVANMGQQLGTHTIRIAVKDERTYPKMLKILEQVIKP